MNLGLKCMKFPVMPTIQALPPPFESSGQIVGRKRLSPSILSPQQGKNKGTNGALTADKRRTQPGPLHPGQSTGKFTSPATT